MSSQPLYGIVYADKKPTLIWTWEELRTVIPDARLHGRHPLRVVRVSPAPRATGGER